MYDEAIEKARVELMQMVMNVEAPPAGPPVPPPRRDISDETVPASPTNPFAAGPASATPSNGAKSEANPANPFVAGPAATSTAAKPAPAPTSAPASYMDAMAGKQAKSEAKSPNPFVAGPASGTMEFSNLIHFCTFPPPDDMPILLCGVMTSDPGKSLPTVNKQISPRS